MKAAIDQVAIQCVCSNKAWMKLIEPAPAPPAFEIPEAERVTNRIDEKSQRSERPDSDRSESNRGSRKTNRQQGQSERAPNAEPKVQAGEETEAPPPVTSAPEKPQDATEVDEPFGSGLEPEIATASEPESGNPGPTTESSAEQEKSPESAARSDNRQKKGRRPNRRRRPRRGRKKDGGSSPSSGS